MTFVIVFAVVFIWVLCGLTGYNLIMADSESEFPGTKNPLDLNVSIVLCGPIALIAAIYYIK